MNKKNLLLVIGILGIIISTYNVIAGETVKSNIVGFIMGIALIVGFLK